MCTYIIYIIHGPFQASQKWSNTGWERPEHRRCLTGGWALVPGDRLHGRVRLLRGESAMGPCLPCIDNDEMRHHTVQTGGQAADEEDMPLRNKQFA